MNKSHKRLLVLLISVLVIFKAQSQEKTIDDYISQALNNSPLLKDLSNQILLNKLDSALVLANYRLKVGANSTGMVAPIIKGFGYDEAVTNGRTFNALLTVNQSLSGRSRMNNDIKGISLLSDSVNNAVKLSTSDLRRNIISQYITAYASQKQAEFDRKVYHLLREEEIILKKLTQNNVYKQADYLNFLVTFKQQELLLKQDEANTLNNLATLNFLSGIETSDSVTLAEPILNLKLEKQLNQSLFLKQFGLDSLRIQNNRRVIGLNYRPQVGVYADGGYYSSFLTDPYKNFGFSAGFTIAVPIYDGHQRKLQYNKLDIQERTRTTYRDFYQKQYNLQIAQLKQQLDRQEGIYVKINEQIRLTEGLIKVDGKLLQTGDITVADFILAIRNYLDAQNLLKQTNISRLELINQLNYRNQ